MANASLLTKQERAKLVKEYGEKLLEEAREYCKTNGHDVVKISNSIQDIETNQVSKAFQCKRCESIFYSPDELPATYFHITTKQYDIKI